MIDPNFANATRHTTQQAKRCGAILPLVVIMLPVMMILVGFAVDLAYMQNTRMELRAATDLAAKAAATKLSQTDDTAQAVEEAKTIASRNMVGGASLKLSDSDITIGRSEPDANGRWVFNAGGFPPNAVRVDGNRTSSSLGGSVGLFFGSFIGQTYFEPQQSATASFLNVDICLVLDRSTSMKWDVGANEDVMSYSHRRFCAAPYRTSRWMALDSAVQVFIDELRATNADESVALVTYAHPLMGAPCGNSGVSSTLDSPLDSDLSYVESEMNTRARTVWNGDTNIEAGIRTGLDALTDPNRSRAFANRVMIVLTDGHQNAGSALSAVPDCRDERIVVHSITFGDFADQDLMASVATEGAGQHYHARNAASLKAVFRELAGKVTHITE